MSIWTVTRMVQDSVVKETVEADSLDEATALAGLEGLVLICAYVDPQIEEEKAQARAAGLAKLVSLGLTEAEALALAGG